MLGTKRCVALLMVIASACNSQSGPIYQTTNGAIDGYDPVAYFTENQPVQGSEMYSLAWGGTEWRFASEEHLNSFRSDPEKFAPQYGGWCAFAWASGDAVKVDPNAWSIVDGKLYLNYDDKIKQKWLNNKDRLIEAANQHYTEAFKE